MITTTDLARRTTPMADRKHRWIKAAVNPEHKGEFRAKAQAAGESTREYASQHQHDSGRTGQQARLASALMGLHHERAKKRYAAMED